MSSGAGGEVALGNNMERARAMRKAAGFAGEKVVLVAPADQRIARNQLLGLGELLEKLDMAVDLVSTDWANFISWRSNRGAVDQGGWSMCHTLWSGADVLDSTLHPLLRSSGAPSRRCPTCRAGWCSSPGPSGAA